ncbi:mucin-2-like isoform X2 [Paramacrobiotus metropolitanus]|uniref:mucin-2-like isoform X2 n=1 Tax=Paramacrobiotus metropolitanus TaxID=2943436 RepID=UPI0024460F13|nr:mucin-2-like isoform X2 [Paramacrobiotus metropolitanus]
MAFKCGSTWSWRRILMVHFSLLLCYSSGTPLPHNTISLNDTKPETGISRVSRQFFPASQDYQRTIPNQFVGPTFPQYGAGHHDLMAEHPEVLPEQFIPAYGASLSRYSPPEINPMLRNQTFGVPVGSRGFNTTLTHQDSDLTDLHAPGQEEFDFISPLHRQPYAPTMSVYRPFPQRFLNDSGAHEGSGMNRNTSLTEYRNPRVPQTNFRRPSSTSKVGKSGPQSLSRALTTDDAVVANRTLGAHTLNKVKQPSSRFSNKTGNTVNRTVKRVRRPTNRTASALKSATAAPVKSDSTPTPTKKATSGRFRVVRNRTFVNQTLSASKARKKVTLPKKKSVFEKPVVAVDRSMATSDAPLIKKVPAARIKNKKRVIVKPKVKPTPFNARKPVFVSVTADPEPIDIKVLPEIFGGSSAMAETATTTVEAVAVRKPAIFQLSTATVVATSSREAEPTTSNAAIIQTTASSTSTTPEISSPEVVTERIPMLFEIVKETTTTAAPNAIPSTTGSTEAPIIITYLSTTDTTTLTATTMPSEPVTHFSANAAKTSTAPIPEEQTTIPTSPMDVTFPTSRLPTVTGGNPTDFSTTAADLSEESTALVVMNSTVSKEEVPSDMLTVATTSTQYSVSKEPVPATASSFIPQTPSNPELSTTVETFTLPGLFGWDDSEEILSATAAAELTSDKTEVTASSTPAEETVPSRSTDLNTPDTADPVKIAAFEDSLATSAAHIDSSSSSSYEITSTALGIQMPTKEVIADFPNLSHAELMTSMPDDMTAKTSTDHVVVESEVIFDIGATDLVSASDDDSLTTTWVSTALIPVGEITDAPAEHNTASTANTFPTESPYIIASEQTATAFKNVTDTTAESEQRTTDEAFTTSLNAQSSTATEAEAETVLSDTTTKADTSTSTVSGDYGHLSASSLPWTVDSKIPFRLYLPGMEEVSTATSSATDFSSPGDATTDTQPTDLPSFDNSTEQLEAIPTTDSWSLPTTDAHADVVLVTTVPETREPFSSSETPQSDTTEETTAVSTQDTTSIETTSTTMLPVLLSEVNSSTSPATTESTNAFPDDETDDRSAVTEATPPVNISNATETPTHQESTSESTPRNPTEAVLDNTSTEASAASTDSEPTQPDERLVNPAEQTQFSSSTTMADPAFTESMQITADDVTTSSESVSSTTAEGPQEPSTIENIVESSTEASTVEAVANHEPVLPTTMDLAARTSVPSEAAFSQAEMEREGS